MMTDEQIIEKLATEVMGWGANWRQHTYGEPWEPLRRMDHAWMVVHKLWREDGRTVWVGPDTVDGGYAAQYRPYQNGTLCEFVREETAPRAICLAALIIKGIEVEL